jgi:hypothetical protein
MFEFGIKIQFSDMVTDEHSLTLSSGGTITLTEGLGPKYSAMLTTHSYFRKINGMCPEHHFITQGMYTCGSPLVFLCPYMGTNLPWPSQCPSLITSGNATVCCFPAVLSTVIYADLRSRYNLGINKPDAVLSGILLLIIHTHKGNSLSSLDI